MSPNIRNARERYQRQIGNGPMFEVATKNGSMFPSEGYVYVRVPGGFSDGGNIIRHPSFPMRYEVGKNFAWGEGRKVNTRLGADGKLEISGHDPADLKQAGISPRELNANDPATRFKTIELLTNLQSFPTGGDGTVKVMSGIYQKPDGGFNVFQGQQNIDLLTGYTPTTADNQHIVALWINTDTNAIEITTSSELSQAIDLKLVPATAMTYLAEAVAGAPFNFIGTSCYIVRGDDTAIDETNKFHDLRGIIGAGSGSGSIGYPDPVISPYILPENKTVIVFSGMVIESGGSVTVSAGSALRMIGA